MMIVKTVLAKSQKPERNKIYKFLGDHIGGRFVQYPLPRPLCIDIAHLDTWHLYSFLRILFAAWYKIVHHKQSK